MHIDVGNVRAQVVAPTPDERVWLSEFLTFMPESARYTSEGPTRFFVWSTNTFPAGLVPLVKQHAEMRGFTVHVRPRTHAPCFLDEGADLGWLHPFQREAVHTLANAQRGILQVPTGGGKTEIAIGLTRVMPVRWIVLVHRAQLAEQMAERFERRTPGVRAGRFFEGTYDVGDDVFMCTTFQSMARAIEHGNPHVRALIDRTEGVIVDEAHVAAAKVFGLVVNEMGNAYFRFGLSGTPLARGDDKNLITVATLGPVVYRVRARTLIDLGLMAEPDIRMLTCEQVYDRSVSWGSVYKRAVVHSRKRNDILALAARQCEKPALLFVKELAHGKRLLGELQRVGVRATFVWGAKDVASRQRAIRDLEAGRIEVIVCSVVFDTGIDIPDLRTVINGAGGDSMISALQRVGRGTRVTKDKKRFSVVDIMDEGERRLASHALHRRAAFLGEGYRVTVET